MTDTDQTSEQPTTTAKCLWCGSERPVEVDVCPACEHAWIDATIDEARSGKLDELTPAVPDAPEAERSFFRRHRLLLSLIVAVALVYGVILLIDRDGTDPATTAAATTSTSTTAAPSTTSAPTTAAPTTAAPTTIAPTTAAPTTTTTTVPPIAAVEPAYDLTDLTLGAFALGPISFGNSDPDVIGRLVATFGQPDSIEPANERYGLCEGEIGRAIEFGYLTVITRADGGGEEIVGYRHRNQDFAPDHASGALQTISGLRLGDTLGDAQQLYSRVVTAELSEAQDKTLPAGSRIYVVQRSSDGRTLIWGGLAETEDAEDQLEDSPVRSINSPNSCDGGPRP